MTVSKFPSLEFHLPKGNRHLAYSSVGDANSPHVLLCLPGLLETRATFDPLLKAADGLQGLRVISVDLCGRGDSSPLLGDKGYTMQVYLEDIEHFIRTVLMPEGCGRLLATVVGERRSIPTQEIRYVEQLRTFVSVLYDGPFSAKSITLMNGYCRLTLNF